LYMKP